MPNVTFYKPSIAACETNLRIQGIRKTWLVADENIAKPSYNGIF
jgi:hypothetical protein